MRATLLVVAVLLSLAAPGQPRGAFVHTAPTSASAGVALKLEGTLVGGPFAKVVARARPAGGDAYQEFVLELRYGDLYRGEVPPARVAAPGLEYYLEGVTAAGARVGLFASAMQPVFVPVTGEPFSFDAVDDNPYTRSPSDDGPDRCKKRKGKTLPKGCEALPGEAEPAAEPAAPTTQEPALSKAPPATLSVEPAVRPVGARSELEEELAVYGAETSSGVVLHVEDAAQTQPHGVTVFTAAQLKQLGVRYVHEVLELTPGFSVSRDVQGFYRVAVRGLRADAQVLFTLNGQKLNNFYDGKALASLPVDTLNRLEIVRGPMTADVGLGNVSALVNLVSNRDEGLRASASMGLYEAFDGHLSGAKTFGRLKAFVDGDVSSQFGVRRPVLRDGLDGPTPRPKTTRDTRLLVNLGAGATYDHALLGPLTLSGRFLLEHRTPLIGLFDVVGNDSTLQWQVVQAALQWSRPLAVEHRLSARAWLDLQQTLRLWQLSYDGYQARAGDAATLFPRGTREQVQVGTSGFGAEVRGEFKLPAKNQLVATLLGDFQWLSSYAQLTNYVPTTLVNIDRLERPEGITYPTEGPEGRRGPAADRFDLGVSVCDTWSLFDAVAVQVGLRFDLLTLPRATAQGAWGGTQAVPLFGPRLGLVVKPTSSLLLRGTYGRSARAPTVQEYTQTVPNVDSSQGRLVGNPLLVSEALDSVEAGFEYLQGIGDGRLRLHGQGFFERLQDAIAGVDTSGNLVPWANRPLGVQALGLEGEARLELTARATVWINVSWVRAEDRGTPATARLLTDVPQVRLNAGVSLPLGRYLAFDVITRYASERRNNSRSVLELIRRYTLPAYATFAAQLRTEQLFEHLELAIVGQNVFNLEYADDATRPDRVPGGVPRETAQVFATARVVF